MEPKYHTKQVGGIINQSPKHRYLLAVQDLQASCIQNPQAPWEVRCFPALCLSSLPWCYFTPHYHAQMNLTAQ